MKFKKALCSTLQFLKKETVLSIAAILAVVSAFFVPPSRGYLEYIDFRVLALLYCLMLVVAGLQGIGVFRYLGDRLLRKVRSTRQLSLLLVALCFFSGMFITNDVALITFVPFAVMVLTMAGQETLLIPVVVLQTIAANLGSMLTPIGNPQNLYLYSAFELPMGTFLLYMLPLTAASALLLVLAVLFLKNHPLHTDAGSLSASADSDDAPSCAPASRPQPFDSADSDDAPSHAPASRPQPFDGADPVDSPSPAPASRPQPSDGTEPGDGPAHAPAPQRPHRGKLAGYLLLFAVCLACVIRILPWPVMLATLVVAVLILDRSLFAKADYFLLLTFVCFFLFIGNVGRIPAIADFLRSFIEKRELLLGVLLSQFISNVPTAILLSGFTENVRALLYGVNVGGLGTLIASLASVISFRLYGNSKGASKGAYVKAFTLYNVAFLLMLCGLAALLLAY